MSFVEIINIIALKMKKLKKFNFPNWNLVKFNIGDRKLNPFITIKQNKVKDGDIFHVFPCKNITFREIMVMYIHISIDENYPFKTAVEYFLVKIDKTESYQSVRFAYNANAVNAENNAPMKQIFKYNLNPVVNYFNI